MTVFIVDIYTSGHHLTYIQLFTKLFQQIGYKVIILLPKVSSKEIEVSNLIKNNSFAQIFYFDYLNSPSIRGRIAGRDEVIKKWEAISESIKANQGQVKGPMFAFFPYLDPFLGPYIRVQDLDKVFPYRWGGVYMNPPNCRVPQSFGWLRKGILSHHNLLKSKNCKTVFVYDPLCAEILSRHTKTQVIPIPDIIDDSSPNHNFEPRSEIIEKAKGRKIISLLGSISKRKGLLTLLQVVPFLQKHFFFLIAGKLDIHSFNESDMLYIKETIKHYSDDILFYDERIPTESDFNALIEISDIIFATYQNFYTSSNLVSKAAFFKKPIIVSKGFLMEEVVNRYQLGLAVESNNNTELVNSLNEMISPEYIERYKRENKSAEYCALFSDTNLCSLLEMLN